MTRELIDLTGSRLRMVLILSLKQLLPFLLAVVLCALSGRADSIPGSILIDFETASNGTVITAPIMVSSSKGASLGTWSTQQGSASAETAGATPNLTISTSASFPLYTPANINGTLYDGSGTRGMRASMAQNNNNAVRLTFSTPLPALSLGFYFRYNGPPLNWAPRDIVLFQDSGGNFQALQIYDQASEAPDNIPYFHTHQQGSPGVGNDVYFQRNTWYWVTIFRAPAGGRIKISFYNPANNYALLGESTASVTSGTGPCRWMTFGAFKYSYNGQSVDFDNMIINTNGVYPLGPGGGPLTLGGEPVIPDSRRPDWSQQTVGIPGGIPNRTTIYTTLNPGDNIQTAINNCPVGQVVKLNAGTYDIGNLRIGKSITLRGAGPNSTLLRYNGGNGITIESDVLNGGETALNLHGGYTKGSSNVTTTASSANLHPGYVVLLDQLNDDSYLVFPTGNNGARTDTSRNSGTRLRSQAVIVTSINNGTNIAFWPPLTYHLTNTMSPQLYFRNASSATNNYVSMAGVEDLAITNTSSGGATGFLINRANYCWLSNVASYESYDWHVSMRNSFRNEIRHSLFRGTKTTANGAGYCISLDYQCCSVLIEDNIIADNRQFVQVNGGGTGNVVAYNYMTNALASSQAPSYTVKTGGHHNAHPMMNLFEGNVAYKFTGDFTWGSSSHNTFFRNWTKALMPYSSQSGTAFELDEKAQYYNLVGNVIGYPGITSHSGFTEWVSVRVSPALMDYGNTFASFRVGYYSSGGDSGGGKNQTNQWNNYIVAGNYEYVAGAQTYYNGAQPEAIPASYLYASKPAYFGNLPWPPFNPASPGSVSETNIPAGYRWRYGIDPVAGSGNQPPSAFASASSVSGVAPLSVVFSSAGSSDPEGTPLSYNWTFGDGGNSSLANPSHTYQSIGNYQARLTVSDGTNSASSGLVNISVLAPGASLVAAYSFAEGAGTITADTSGNGNNGSLGSATWAANGKFGNALSFNGSSRVIVADSSSLDLVNLTLSAWVHPTAVVANSWGTVLMKETATGLAYALDASSPANRPMAFVYPYTLEGLSALPLNTWSHLAATYDGIVLNLFVNGNQVASVPGIGQIVQSTGVLSIGGNGVWGEYFQGMIDEVRIYNRALSAGEIQADMETPVGQGSRPLPPVGLRIVSP